jgi:stearoyl-CoA desaturase (delta-9 desaturase)
MAVEPMILYKTGNVFGQTLHDMRRFLSTLQPNNITFCIILPLTGFFWSFFQSLTHQTFILGVILYIISGVGITAGK